MCNNNFYFTRQKSEQDVRRTTTNVSEKNDGKSSIAKCISKEKQCDQIEQTERCTTATDVQNPAKKIAWRG